MNWHTGNIAEAVAESKAKDAIFVVYIEGKLKKKCSLLQNAPRHAGICMLILYIIHTHYRAGRDDG